PAEGGDLLLEVKVAGQQEVHADLLVLDDAVGDLLGRADETGLETVVVLDEVLEGGVRPHALAVLGGGAGLLHGLPEALDGGAVRLGDDLAQRVLGLLTGLAGDDEAVQPESRGAAGLGGGGEDAGDVLLVALEGAAVGEVPVGDAAGGGLR